MVRTTRRGGLVTVLGLGLGCYGGLDEDAEPPGAAADSTTTGSAAETEDDAASEPDAPPEASVGPMPLRRLTNDEFSNTMRDLLGDTTRPGDGLPADGLGTAGFATPGLVSPVDVRTIAELARDIAQRALGDLDALLPCSAAADGEDACARAFIEHFGLRAFRRPLEPEEIERAYALYEVARGDHGESFEEAIGTLIEAMVQAPQLMYRWELGLGEPELDGGSVRLGDYEMASRLSYFLWSSMPDATLLEAAKAGELRSAEQIEQQARRMLADDKAVETLHSFQRQWLHLDGLLTSVKAPSRYPEFDEDLARAMLEETQAFFVHVIREGEGDLTTLLTADYSLLDDRLAALYGVEAPGSDVPVRVELSADQRAGLLTQAAFLSTHARPDIGDVIRRGVTVGEQVMCVRFPSPPNDIPPLPDVDPNQTQREFFGQHAADPGCQGCHGIIDPIGFGFMNYDAIGRWSDEDAGGVIDASGELWGGSERALSFEGPVELAHALADDEQVRRCFTEQWYRFALLRGNEAVDEPHLERIYAEFSAADYNVQSLLISIARSDAFRFRALAEGEVLP